MDAIEAIMTRRSIRKYTDRGIPGEIVEKLLRAGMAAPSAGNQQPWHFVIIDDRKVLDQIPTFHRYSKMLLEAPLAILVCGDLSRELHEGYWIQDCSAATENILLAAHALGLGAVWLGIHPREERKKGIIELMNLPDSIQPLSLISIGYPAERKPPSDRYLQDRVHKNQW